MTTNSFIHLNGIGEEKEKTIWRNGIHNWTDFIKSSKKIFNAKLTNRIIKELSLSFEHLEICDPLFFAKRLPNNQHWRLFPEFNNSIAYLDIETTGLSPFYDKITTIVLYDGTDLKHYVNGNNLDEFKSDIKKYQLLITYNGKCFDIPFIEEYFKIKLPQAQIDLRYVLHSLGYKGGLKGCEKQLGLQRGDLEDIDGLFAIYLWEEFQNNNNISALETLLSYNIEDVINLEQLMIISYNKKIMQNEFKLVNELEPVIKPKNIFEPNLDLVEMIKVKYYSFDNW